MIFIADVPPVVYEQVVIYKKLTSTIQLNGLSDSREKIFERFSLGFLIQANRFLELSKKTTHEKAKANYERMALIHFKAYLEEVGK